MNLNKYMCAGNLTNDPELLSVGTYNTPLCTFNLAVNTKTKKEDEVLFIQCCCFGKRAEVLAKYLTKGSPLYVDGRLQQKNWEDKEGNKRTSFQILVNEFQFLGRAQTKKEESADDIPF